MSEPYRYRVIYGDTDQMGVVYYATYLRFFEGARNEWIRALGITYRDIEEKGIMLPVYEAAVQLRGDGGARQVPGRCEVAVVSNGGGPIAGCMLLTAGIR